MDGSRDGPTLPLAVPKLRVLWHWQSGANFRAPPPPTVHSPAPAAPAAPPNPRLIITHGPHRALIPVAVVITMYITEYI